MSDISGDSRIGGDSGGVGPFIVSRILLEVKPSQVYAVPGRAAIRFDRSRLPADYDSVTATPAELKR